MAKSENHKLETAAVTGNQAPKGKPGFNRLNPLAPDALKQDGPKKVSFATDSELIGKITYASLFYVTVVPRSDRSESENLATQALFNAIRAGDVKKASEAIKNGADLDSKCLWTLNYTPMEWRDDPSLERLVTPLGYAIRENRRDIVDLLHSCGAKE